MKNFTITPNAINRIKQLITQEPENAKLKIIVEGGGCSGFQYQYVFTTENNYEDIIIYCDDIAVIIDSLSYQFLENSILDFIENLGSS